MPPEEGNAHITHKCYFSFLFALGQWDLSGKISLKHRNSIFFRLKLYKGLVRVRQSYWCPIKNLTLKRGACTLVFLDFFCVTNVKQHFNKVNAIFFAKKKTKKQPLLRIWILLKNLLTLYKEVEITLLKGYLHYFYAIFAPKNG